VTKLLAFQYFTHFSFYSVKERMSDTLSVDISELTDSLCP